MKRIFTATIFSTFIACFSLNAQTNTFPANGAAGIGTLTPNASSLLEINSTTKGLLISRMTKAQRDAIVLPAAGLLIYQTNSTPGFYYYDGSAWRAITTKPGWLLTGNAGTDSSKQFLGTTDAHPLAFRVNNKRSGWIDFTGNDNTSFGYQGLLANTTGFYNTAIGHSALKANTTGGRNTAVGFFTLLFNNANNNTAIGTYALEANTNGTGNTATGASALSSNIEGNNNAAYGTNGLAFNTNGNENTATGISALYSNVSANDNTATGFAALYSNTSNNNTATGAYALYANTIGLQNTATGYASLYSNISGNYNSAHGAGALNSNTTGVWNTATGTYAMYLNKTGYYNSAIGGYALYSNISGTNNTANGYNALYNNTASNNTATGASALYANTTGNNNTATGLEALHFNTEGDNNTATGLDALLSNTTGSNNTAAGYASLSGNAGGSYNTANGYNALLTNSQGSYNTALGASALYSGNVVNNTAVGYASLYSNASGNDNTAVGSWALNGATGSQNTAIGSRALQSAFNGFASGSGCTATGYQALNKNSGGSYNTADGYNALFVNESGNYNTAVGTNALISVTTGSRNIGIGYLADVDAGFQNSIMIGTGVKLMASNLAKIGNASTSYLDGPVYITVSDARFKKNIIANVPGLDFINSLRPVTYQYKSAELQKHLAGNDAAMLAQVNQLDYKDADNKVHLGFIAQEVEKIMNDKGYKGDIVKKPVNAQDNYGLAYSEFIPPVVKAIQQLSIENDSLKNVTGKQQQQLNGLAELINDLQRQVNDLKLRQEQCCDHTTAINTAVTKSSLMLFEEATLQQNIPNPFNHTTTIGYVLPQKFTNAQIVITAKTGKTLKTVTISGSGKGSLNVDASTLASGAYQYSLVVGGRLIDTKQMILAK